EIACAGQERFEKTLQILNSSQDIANRLIYSPDKQCELLMDIDGVPYKIREICPRENPNGGLLEVTPDTKVRLFAPSGKAGVDIVILADCSGSMGVPDLTDFEAQELPSRAIFGRLKTRTEPAGLTRMEALHRALHQLLSLRLEASGRESRIALVGFTTQCRQLFPSKGMLELDEETSVEIEEQFRSAIGLLRARTEATDIGEALHFAGELLHIHGRQGNDKLIVLISDGAHWKPRGDDATGEFVAGIDEPISLMANLHRATNVSLHAIGISNPELFNRWFHAKYPSRQPDEYLIPNHALLERLVEQGGGDPSRVGDANVVAEYFHSLGAGVTRSLSRLKVAKPPELLPFEARQLQQLSTETSSSHPIDQQLLQTRVSLSHSLLQLYKECDRFGINLLEKPLFNRGEAKYDFDDAMFCNVQTRKDWEQFIKDIYRGTFENVPDELSGKKTNGKTKESDESPYQGVIRIFQSDQVRTLCLLRHVAVQNKSAIGDKKEKRDAEKKKQAFVRFVGRSHITEDDAPRWLQLQVAIMRELEDIFKNLIQEFTTLAASKAP
ncbi:MAG: VWA domain-containing protein, partial [Planctomycetaceae bacterium]|nr:VWA domain-containing protein [Planctomycetaceae bacterium]